MKDYLNAFALTLVATLALAGGPAAEALAAEPIVLKVSHFLPPGHSVSRDIAAWGEEIKARSGGRLQFEIHPSSKLAPPPKQYDLAASGQADIALALHGYTPGKFPLTEVAQLAFVVQQGATSSAKLSELAPKFLAREHPGVKILFLLTSPPVKFHLAHKRIDSVQDFKGLRLRVSTSAVAEAVRSLGGIPIEMPPGKVADAVKNGELDGAMFPYEAVKAFRINEVSKYSVEPGFNSVTFFLVMNQKRYDALPKDLQKLIDETTGPEAARRFGAHLDEQENAGREVMVQSGVQVIKLSNAAVSRIEAMTVPSTTRALAALEKKGYPANMLYLEMVSANASVK